MKKKNPAIPKNMPKDPQPKSDFKEWHDKQYWESVDLELSEDNLFNDKTQEPDHD